MAYAAHAHNCHYVNSLLQCSAPIGEAVQHERGKAQLPSILGRALAELRDRRGREGRGGHLQLTPRRNYEQI